MGRIQVNAPELQGLADTIVKHITHLEKENKRLAKMVDSVYDRINSADYRYRHLLTSVPSSGEVEVSFLSLNARLDESEAHVRETAEKMLYADQYVEKGFDWYNKIDSFIIAGKTGLAGIAFSLGGAFLKEDINGKIRYAMNPNWKFPKKWMEFYAKWKTIGAKGLISNKTLFELFYKKMAGGYPKDVAKLTNAGLDALDIANNKSLKIGERIAAGGKTVLKGSLGFARTTGLTALLANTVEAGIVGGMQVANNYSKYGNNSDVLKRENAKVVGKQVNDVVWKSAGAAVGSVAGGALLSFMGPPGVVIGGAVGGLIGNEIGGKLAPLTAGLAEDIALKHKETIHKVVDGGRELLEKAGDGINAVNKGVDKVKDAASKALDNAKDFFSKPFSFS